MASYSQPNIHHSQNFLKDPRLVTRLLGKCNLSRDDVVLEIGPGKGIITDQLSRVCQQVIAVEKDTRLAAMLRVKFAGTLNVTIHAGDFLEYRLPRKPYKVFANIPFNITAAILTKLTAAEYPPSEATLAMQKEAAEMYLGKPHESLRTVLLKPWFEVELVHRFQREDFTPVPQVEVVMLRLRKRGPPLVMPVDRQRFRDFVVYGFTAWRPTLGGTLKGIFPGQQLKRVCRNLGIDLEGGPASLPFEQWLNLFECFKSIGNEQAMHMISGSEKRLAQQQNQLQKIHRTRAYGWNDIEKENSPGRNPARRIFKKRTGP